MALFQNLQSSLTSKEIFRHILGFIVISLITSGYAQTTFQITSPTEARFYIDEVLLGSVKTVVGFTPLVTGEAVFSLEKARQASLGMIAVDGLISVDARDLKTDDDNRNRSIRNNILYSDKDEYQFITFKPTRLEDLPASFKVGDTINCTIVGDLHIYETKQEEAFAVTLTVTSETQLSGVAIATIQHKDYALSIPWVPTIARANDEVKLELAFSVVAKGTE